MQKIGHRGAKALVDENTIASIEKAIELGVDAVEIDIHKCATGELVVMHDETVKRTTNGKGKIVNLSFSELSMLRTEHMHKIPTLAEVLMVCQGKCKLHIELKGKGTAKAACFLIEATVAQNKWTYDQLCVSSFDAKRLNKIKARNGNIKVGLITESKTSKALAVAVNNNYDNIYIFHEKLRSRFVRMAKQKNLNVYAWTVNKPADIKKMQALEISGIISDNPDLL
ncbi:glycerophosphodiester phosphodiesterase [Aquimarina agarivorans]|uniref:glycerophosphodiester phosphodiesterase n=1 Tax=Aquimarina agarivorans TaxID=980584 RepID=UPI000248E6E5|nr:glycerophosphodiester phosphodiesterase [Aquimarina agarivorans]